MVDGHEETIAVRGADPVTVEVLATERGPLFEVDRDRGRGLAVRDAPTVLGDLGFEALLPLLRARTVDDVDRALDAWVAPVNNVVIADRSGAVRFRNAGRVPLRADANRRGIVPGAGGDTWSGWVDAAAPRRRRPTARWSPPTSDGAARASCSASSSPRRTGPPGSTRCSAAATT